MKNRKKGFTLVELLVVIAILAVLATVTTVGYLSFTNKAKESNDISLTTQMNNILLGETATEGANKVPHDAVLDLQENGLDVTKLTPTSDGYEFVWDLKQDKFFLLDKTGKQIAPQDDTISTNKIDVFKIVGKDGTLSNEYSNYLKNDYVSNGTETISTGFDAGENTTVKTLNYNNTTARTTTIRTNGGTLNVNAPNDTVNHYGELKNVDVVEVADHSYHEYGNVSDFKVAKGNVVLEEKSNVNHLKVSSTDKAVTISNKGNVEVLNVIDNTSTAVSNNGVISNVIAKPTQEVTGTKPVNPTINEVKQLTPGNQVITLGGYYDGNGATFTNIDGDNYALIVDTTEPVIINNLTIEGTRGVRILQSNSNVSLNNIKGTVIRSFIQINDDNNNYVENVIIKLNNSEVYSKGVLNFDTELANNTSNTIDSLGLFFHKVNNLNLSINNTLIVGFHYSIKLQGFSKNNNCTIDNSTLKGRCGLYVYQATDSKFNVINSHIHGINLFKSEKEEFGNIVVDNNSSNNTVNTTNTLYTIYRIPATVYNFHTALEIRGKNNIINILENNTVNAEVHYEGSATIPNNSSDLPTVNKIKYPDNTKVNGSFEKAIYTCIQGNTKLDIDWK